MASSKDKGKAPADRSSSKVSERTKRRRALDRALARHYEKKSRRAERRRMLENDDSTDEEPLNALHAFYDESSSDDFDENTQGNPPQARSEQDWDDMTRANEAMSEELAHLRAMAARQTQLTDGATPGASGSSSGGAPTFEDANTRPVALGAPALNKTPPRDKTPAPAPSQTSPDQGSRRFVPLPKSKTSKNIEDIQRDAGLGDNHERWLEISNIIRDLMTRVGMDYANSWLRQDKSRLGILYALILKEAPELGAFQNGWATEWLVQNKFNNHRYYVGKHRKRKHSAIKEEDDDEDGHRSPPPAPAPLEPSPPPRVLPPPSPPRPQSPPLPAVPLPQRPSPQPQPQPQLQPDHPPSDQELAQPHPQPQPQLPPPSSRRSAPRTRRTDNNRSTPAKRYNTRTRAAAVAAAVAETNAVVEQSDQRRSVTGRTSKRKNQPRKSESPLRALEESDDGGRLTDEEDA